MGGLDHRAQVAHLARRARILHDHAEGAVGQVGERVERAHVERDAERFSPRRHHRDGLRVAVGVDHEHVTGLGADAFVKAAESTAFPPDMFGSPPMKFSGNFRLGNDQSRMAQIQNGRWTKVSDYLPVPGAKK